MGGLAEDANRQRRVVDVARQLASARRAFASEEHRCEDTSRGALWLGIWPAGAILGVLFEHRELAVASRTRRIPPSKGRLSRERERRPRRPRATTTPTTNGRVRAATRLRRHARPGHARGGASDRPDVEGWVVELWASSAIREAGPSPRTPRSATFVAPVRAGKREIARGPATASRAIAGRRTRA